MESNISISEWQKGIAGSFVSWLGTEIILPVTFGEVRESVIKNGRRTVLVFPEWTLPPTTILRFNRSKRIVETEMIGVDGTVKEFVGWSNWKISLTGVITPSAKGDYGLNMEAVNRVKLLDEISTKIPIYNIICEQLSIYYVVVETVEISPTEGNSQPFSLTLLSESDAELIIS